MNMSGWPAGSFLLFFDEFLGGHGQALRRLYFRNRTCSLETVFSELPHPFYPVITIVVSRWILPRRVAHAKCQNQWVYNNFLNKPRSPAQGGGVDAPPPTPGFSENSSRTDRPIVTKLGIPT